MPSQKILGDASDGIYVSMMRRYMLAGRGMRFVRVRCRPGRTLEGDFAYTVLRLALYLVA